MVVGAPRTSLLAFAPGTRVVVGAPAASLRACLAGPPGPKGDPGDGVAQPDLTVTAGATLGGHRVVRVSASGAVYADASQTDVEAVLGVTTGAATLGAPVSVRPAGALVEPSWAWLPGSVYLGRDGTMTQAPPDGDAALEVGFALAPDTLYIRIQQVIYDG